MKRFFDVFFSTLAILILFPFFVIISLFIVFDSKGGVFYRQQRVGKNSSDFWLYKFRTMAAGADKDGLLTIGSNDSRVTKVGLILRKFKIDELPQLINIFLGDMSIVGPRPEVRKYVNLYNAEQMKVLSVRPGLTDFASIVYINENELLAQSNEPENLYINRIMPAKLKLNLKYIEKNGIQTDLAIIFKTIKKIIS